MSYEMRDTGSLNYASTVYNDFHMTKRREEERCSSMGCQMSFYYLAQYHYFLSLFNK